MNIKTIGLLLFFSSTIISFEPPQGRKRPAQEISEQEPKAQRAESESEGSLAESTAERLEPVSGAPIITEPKIGLAELPNELIVQLSKLINTASGSTDDEKLFAAAGNVRRFFRINKAYNHFFKDPHIHLEIIKQLAKAYTPTNDWYAAAFALATDEASQMIGFTINDAIAFNDDSQAYEQKPEDAYILKHFKDYLIDAIKRERIDSWKFFTKHLEPGKLAFILDNLRIDGKQLLLFLIDSNNKKMFEQVSAVPDIDFNSADENGRTPLIAAIAAGNANLVNFLAVQESIDINLADNNGDTPILVALRNNDNSNIVNSLLAENPDVNVLNNAGETPLIVAIKKNDLPMVQRLLQVPGINVNLAGAQPEFAIRTQSALHWAVQKGNIDIVRALINVPGIQIDAVNEYGGTPLFSAIVVGKDDIVDLLVRSGAQVNIQDNIGMTPLMAAVRVDNALSISYLINPPGNADLTLRDAQGHTALWHARDEGKIASITILQQLNAPE